MFVVFEGTDGSGKTTVSNRVADRLREQGLRVTHVRAEGKFASSVSEAIRSLGRDSRNLELTASAEFLLYVARDVQLVEEALRPALSSADVVLADRFLYTAEVLGRFGRGLESTFTGPILEAARGGLNPDLVIFVDVDPSLARARRKAHKLDVGDARPPSRKGLSGVGLQQRLRHGYLELAASEPERWVVVDNENALDETVARVTALIAEARRSGAPAAIERFRSSVPARSAPTPVGSVEEAQARFLAWVDARAEREPHVAAYMLGGLAGEPIDARRRALVDRVPKAVLAALAGLDDALSWELRERLETTHPALVARSLSGVARVGARAAALRKRLAAAAPVEALTSTARLDDEAAWALRDRLVGEALEAVVASLAGLSSPRAWALRDAWLARVGSALERDETVRRTALRSVHGLDDELAWKLRMQARSQSPVAALASIGLLTSHAAWDFRERFLRHAPKVVMTTLRGLCEPRAWALRRAVARHCKEALDSVLGLDTAEAWELRQSLADVWPSTVVKSLGALADDERGIALVKRQLERYPGNLSLLKHAAAVALGTHRRAAPTDD